MTQYIFFSGKGGVGKTSMACTHAVRYADEGKRTLIVTTDQASNLSDTFEQPIGHQVSSITNVPDLWAMEIDPDKATQEYIDRAMAPIRAAFPPQLVQVMEEQMSGPCTAEVAAFDRFTDFLEVSSSTDTTFDVVIFDTAPIGHTIRLLELPAEWSQSINAASAGTKPTGYVHPKALAALAEIGIQHQGRSKSADEFKGVDFDLVVTVCDSAAAECPLWLGKGKRVHHSFPDPAKTDNMNDFRNVRDGMEREIIY